MKKLYLITTKGLGNYYVIAKDPTEAENTLTSLLDEHSYGFTDSRQVVNIQWLSTSIEDRFGISDKNKRLLIK